jgi:hypothetical protein
MRIKMKKRAWVIPTLIFISIIICSGCNFPIDFSGKPNESGLSATATLPPSVEEGATVSSTAETEQAITATDTAEIPPLTVSFVDSSRNLYVWREGYAAPAELVNSGDVVESHVSTDGNLIAFIRSSDYSNYDLDVVNFDGSNRHTLISNAQFNAFTKPDYAIGVGPNRVSWKPGSHILGFSTRAVLEGPGLLVPGTFYTLDVDSGTLQQLIHTEDGFSFSFSPDGNFVAISRPTGIDLYHSDGSLVAENVVTFNSVNTASEYAWTADISWKNDSSSFCTVIAPEEPWVDEPAASIVWQVSNTGAAAMLYSGVMSFFPMGIASFSPDLSLMNYRTQEGNPLDNNWALHVSLADGSGNANIDTGYFGHLAEWSPDGQKFIYSKLDGSNNLAFLVNGNSTPDHLADVVSLLDAKWVDDSHFIVSSHTENGDSLLYGTINGPTGVIFNDSTSTQLQNLSFDVNR